MSYQNPVTSSTTPSISVIIPVYNGERYLAEAVASIRAQNYAQMEIIIVNDGSTDDTAAVVHDLGNDIRYFYQSNAGPSAARNRGLLEAQGELIAFLDADDIWVPGKLECQADYLSTHSETDIVQGLSQQFRMVLHGKTMTHEFMDRVWSPKPDSALFRRQVFDRVGSFDVQMHRGEDLDWFYRARELGVHIAVLKEISIYYRRHVHSLTNNEDATSMTGIAALRASLRRRRQAGNGVIRALEPVSIQEVK